MVDADARLISSWIRVILSLREPQLRVDWLRQALAQRSGGEGARLLNRLCADSERGHVAAREVALAVALLLVQSGPDELLVELRRQAEQRRLLSLERLVSVAPESARTSEAPAAAVPDYGAGRELTVGERRSLARRPNREAFERLLRDPHPLVMRQLLDNPKLTEDDVVRLAAKRPARKEILGVLCQHLRWLVRRRVRLVLILNPGTPAWMAKPLLSACSRAELRLVMSCTELSGCLRATAREYFELMPPLNQPVGDLALIQ